MITSKAFAVVSFLFALVAFCLGSSLSLAEEKAPTASFRDVMLNETPEFSHPLGQTRVDVLQQSGLVANAQYGAIKFIGDTLFEVRSSSNQTTTLNNHPVFAAQSGYFYMHGVNPDGTRRVLIKHLDGSKTYYSHIDMKSIAFNDGAAVQKGEILGRVSGDTFGFSIVDRNNISKTSSFETVEGKQLTSFSVNVAKKSYGFIMDAEDKRRKENSNIAKVSSTEPPFVFPDEDDDFPDGPPFPEPPIHISPDLCELVECPNIGGPTQGVLDVVATYIRPRDYPKPYQELDNSGSYENSPQDLQTDYCPPVIRRALNERQGANIDFDERMRRDYLKSTIDFKRATCFQNFQAKIMGPISSIFSQGGGNSGAFMQQIMSIAGQLGISIPLVDGQLPIVGDIMGIFNRFLGQGCTGGGSMGDVMRLFKQNFIPSITMDSNTGSYGGWKTQIVSLIGRPDQRYMEAANLGRYFDDGRSNAMDQYILRFERCRGNPNCN